MRPLLPPLTHQARIRVGERAESTAQFCWRIACDWIFQIKIQDLIVHERLSIKNGGGGAIDPLPGIIITRWEARYGPGTQQASIHEILNMRMNTRLVDACETSGVERSGVRTAIERRKALTEPLSTYLTGVFARG